MWATCVVTQGPALKDLVFGIMLSCNLLTILVVYENGDLYFHFTLKHTNYESGPAWRACLSHTGCTE